MTPTRVKPGSGCACRLLSQANDTPWASASGVATSARCASRASSMSTAVTASPGRPEASARMTCMKPIGPAAPMMPTRSPSRSSPVPGAMA